MELFRALGALAEPPSDATRRLADLLELGEPPRPGEYEDVFLFQLYPYASVYLGAEGKMGGEARDRIAGFWRALDLDPPPEPDHLTIMLGMYARLAELEASSDGGRERQGWRHARTAWFWEHLASWLPVYLDRAAAIGGSFYRAWAVRLILALTEEADTLAPPTQRALHLREAPPLSDPRRAASDAPARAFVEELLSPVRAGYILVAADLQRAAAELGLGLRAGERRFVLEALLGQDPAATLGWLAGHAAGAASSHEATPPGLAPTTDFWAERAHAASTLIASLAEEAAGSADQF